MARKYKQKCFRCNKNYVVVGARQRFAKCYECQKPELEGVIEDEKMKEFFNIPDDFYKDNSFLRSIKISYLKNKRISDRQAEAFIKVVDEMKSVINQEL